MTEKTPIYFRKTVYVSPTTEQWHELFLGWVRKYRQDFYPLLSAEGTKLLRFDFDDAVDDEGGTFRIHVDHYVYWGVIWETKDGEEIETALTPSALRDAFILHFRENQPNAYEAVKDLPLSCFEFSQQPVGRYQSDGIPIANDVDLEWFDVVWGDPCDDRLVKDPSSWMGLEP